MERKDKLHQKAHNQLKSFLSDCQIEELQNKKVLEVGFRNGLFLNECRKRDLICTGIEINREYCRTVKAKFPALDVLWYDGGVFPLPDESFDFVVSYQVLEHVSSIRHVLSECIRVLKPGGIMYHVCPNYHSFYEGHYKIIWLPFLNKTLGRLYLKLIGCYHSGYEDLNIIKPKVVAKILRHHQNNINVISLGCREFINKFNAEQIKKVNQKLLQKILKLLQQLPVIKKCVLEIVGRAGFYYPITITVMKIEDVPIVVEN